MSKSPRDSFFSYQLLTGMEADKFNQALRECYASQKLPGIPEATCLMLEEPGIFYGFVIGAKKKDAKQWFAGIVKCLQDKLGSSIFTSFSGEDCFIAGTHFWIKTKERSPRRIGLAFNSWPLRRELGCRITFCRGVLEGEGVSAILKFISNDPSEMENALALALLLNHLEEKGIRITEKDVKIIFGGHCYQAA